MADNYLTLLVKAEVVTAFEVGSLKHKNLRQWPFKIISDMTCDLSRFGKYRKELSVVTFQGQRSQWREFMLNYGYFLGQ